MAYRYVMDTVNGIYEVQTGYMSSPITFNAATNEVTVPARGEVVTTRAEWRQAVANISERWCREVMAALAEIGTPVTLGLVPAGVEIEVDENVITGKFKINGTTMEYVYTDGSVTLKARPQIVATWAEWWAWVRAIVAHLDYVHNVL